MSPADIELTQQINNENIEQNDQKLDYTGPKW